MPFEHHLTVWAYGTSFCISAYLDQWHLPNRSFILMQTICPLLISMNDEQVSSYLIQWETEGHRLLYNQRIMMMIGR